MKKEDCIKKVDMTKTVGVYIKISRHMSKWLAAEKLSPTAVFEAACKELGYKTDFKATHAKK